MTKIALVVRNPAQRGAANRPQGVGIGAPYQSQDTKSDRAIDGTTDEGIPGFARPLVDGCTVAGVAVRWPFTAGEWFKVHAAIKKSGTQSLVAYAVRTWIRQNGDIDSARYFLRGWCELAPSPHPDTPRPPLAAVPAVRDSGMPTGRPKPTGEHNAEVIAAFRARHQEHQQ
jgi:hypothetical protein